MKGEDRRGQDMGTWELGNQAIWEGGVEKGNLGERYVIKE